MRHNTVAIQENAWFSMGRESTTSSQHCGKERKRKDRQNVNQRRKGGKKAIKKGGTEKLVKKGF